MRKEMSASNRDKLDKLVTALDGIENTVLDAFKKAFNFKGRKSPLIAETAIDVLLEQDGTIYDPFMGSGAFVIAAAMAGHKIVATELDNYTHSAVCALLSSIDVDKLTEMLMKVESYAKTDVMLLYETYCCGQKNYISKLMYDPEAQEYFDPTPNRSIIEGKNIVMVSKCPHCGEIRKKFDNDDKRILDKVNRMDVSAFPQVEYIENSRINITKSTGANYYDRIFTTRNKKALLLIQDAILKLEPCAERDVIQHALVSSLTLARVAMYGSSSDILYHVVPHSAEENNVWRLFEGKMGSFLRFKKSYKDILSHNPSNNEKYQLHLTSYQKYIDSIQEGVRFDLVYTDFPYTDQVPYLERNQLYRIWLNTFYNAGNFELTPEMLNSEIVQTNAPSRPIKKDIATYYSDIDDMFKNFQKILKDAGLVVLTIKLGKSKYFRTLVEIINLARKNGFEYAMRLGIDKNDPTIRKQSAYKNTLANEMIIVFELLDEGNRYWYVENKNYEFETVKIVYKLLQKSEADVTLSAAVKSVRDSLRKKHKHFASDEDLMRIQKIIKDKFYVDDASIVRPDSNILYLDIEDETDLFTKLYDYIPVIIGRLFERKDSFVLDDLYFEVANVLCTGNPKAIEQFLESDNYSRDIRLLLNNYCVETSKGYEKRDYSYQISEEAIDISILEGKDFELVIKRLLEADGYTDVINTGASGDLGVDLEAKKVIAGETKTFIFQCKRWASNVGSTPMQRLDSERSRRGVDYAICVTTSDFTDDGVLVSRAQNIEMWNGNDVIQKLELQFPGEYYHGSLGKSGA
ncbi:MAG: restriction endonuclease [Defluviitaleaceae bacterium]|nr:restriction endonuclease [Defluviitaleaceae bacterium]